MLTRRNRETSPQKTEPTPFAAREKDLGALRDAVVDAAGVGAGLWFSYLFALFYFAIATFAVTHRDLLLENPVKLPFLNVELPLKAFFVLGPLVFLIVHAYVLLHFVLLAGKIGAFDAELEAKVPDDDVRDRLRRQLPSNIFVQFLAGPREVRTGIIGRLLKSVAWISLIAGPIALLVLFPLPFLPYHNQWITNWQRVAVVIDLALLWLLWPPIARGKTALLGWSDFRTVRVRAWLLVSLLPILLVFTIATFPGERLEENLPSFRFVPTEWPPWNSDRASLHELLVAGAVDYVAQRPKSLWSNRLVLPNFEVGDRVKFDPEGKIAISSDTVSLRGRSLEGAVLVNAHLRKADFTGAQLKGADFTRADLREAKFECDIAGEERECARLQGAVFNQAQLQGASLKGAQLQGDYLGSTPLQGARLDEAGLQGAVLPGAQLQGASLVHAQLVGATLNYAQLQGASLEGARLQGASLQEAQLQGASLDNAALLGAWLQGVQLQGVSLSGAQLGGTELRSVYVWRTEAPSQQYGESTRVEAPEARPKYLGLDCPDRKAPCDWSAASFVALKSLIENTVPAGLLRDQALKRIAKLEKPPFVEDEAATKAWAALAEISAHSPKPYWDAVTTTLREIGCDPIGAPYVVLQLIAHLYFRFENNRTEARVLATAFLDEAHCPGARGLGMEKAKLQALLN
jgi:uncharacterized protein YjbI with pentapeptide repeats